MANSKEKNLIDTLKAIIENILNSEDDPTLEGLILNGMRGEGGISKRDAALLLQTSRLADEKARNYTAEALAKRSGKDNEGNRTNIDPRTKEKDKSVPTRADDRERDD